jgi:signal transduction histidine kinase
MSVSKLLGLTIGLLLALAVVGIGLALVATSELNSDRKLLLEQVGPSLRSSIQLEDALVNEETGVRGYLITGRPDFLAPYSDGRAKEISTYEALRMHEHAIGHVLAAEVESVHARADRWRASYVAPVLALRHPSSSVSVRLSETGKRLFDSIRESLHHLQGGLTKKDESTKKRLDRATSSVQFLLVLAGVLILGGVLAAWLLLRFTLTSPLSRLGREAQRVSAGEFHAPLSRANGPEEVAQLSVEIESMRQRIVAELQGVEAAREKVEEQAQELRRSNAELEQFAYVASHDLQEPLRKVASFCQALQTRYQGQLDARADQYIEFAVDGAKRMQSLINDLLAFSRVGRSGRELELVQLREALDSALSALSARLRETDAEVIVGDLPTVRGDRALLASLFQNLIANSLKFQGDQRPRIRIDARPQDERWEISCADNGIGIDQEYAERIFLIFQRLHSREAYEGSGIGLAMCRKIVEYHGGRMWLDRSYSEGACFLFTLPIAKERP